MLRDELHQALCEMPVLDIHTHLHRDRMAARGLHEVVFYHMQMYVMRGAGVTESKMWPEQPCIEAGLPFDEWVDAWPKVRHTGFGWILRTILRDLYEFDEPVTPESLERLRASFEAKTSRDDWPRQVIEKAKVARITSCMLDVKPLEPGDWDPNIRFTVEDMPLAGKCDYRPWSENLRTLGEVLGRDVTTVARLREAVRKYYDPYDWTGKNALVAWVGSEADFTPVPDAELDRIVARSAAGEALPLAERQRIEAAYIRAIAAVANENTRVFQFCYGTQYVTKELEWAHPVQKAAPQFASTWPYVLAEFPDLHFNVLNGYEPDEPIWCAMVQGYGNLSMANFWWQTFYPSVMERAVQRRLDMVPLNKLVGFFSDGWCVDYIYGRLAMIRRVWANALAERIERGLMTRDEAMAVARQVFIDTPGEIFFPGETLNF